MADNFALTAAFDSQAYTPGATMTVTVTGTVTNAPTPVAATVTVTASDGTTQVLTANSSVDGGPLTWEITSVTDTANRTWTIAPGGASATATA